MLLIWMFRAVCYFNLALLVVSCSGSAGEQLEEETVEASCPEATQSIEAILDPDYGPTQHLRGVWAAGLETSNFVYCPSGEDENCVRELQLGCWLEFSEDALEQLESRPEWARSELWSSFWLEFEGRETICRNGYGHQNYRSCQMIVDEIHAVRLLETLEGE